MDAVFRVENENVEVSPFAAGPWNPGLQHGGAPASLVTWVAENTPAPSKMRVARLTLDLMRPVPVAALRIRSAILREGKKIQLVGVQLESGGVEVVRATILKVRVGSTDFAGIANADALDVVPPDEVAEQPASQGHGFASGVAFRAVQGEFGSPGPAAIWFSFGRALIEGQPNSPAMCAVAASDFSNGASSMLDFNAWTFVNADLSVLLAREPRGEWTLLNAQTWLGDDGGGIASSRLADRDGYFGRAVQSLVVERR